MGRVRGNVDHPALAIEASAADRDHLADVADAVRSTFVPMPAVLADLATADRQVARLIDAHPGVVPVLFADPFIALIRSISAQQVNLRWAATIRAASPSATARATRLAGTYVYSLASRAARRARPSRSCAALQLTTAKARRSSRSRRPRSLASFDAADLAALDDEALIEPSDAAARHRPLERRVVPGADARPAARRGRRSRRAQGGRAPVRTRAAAARGRGPPPDRTLGSGRDVTPGAGAARPCGSATEVAPLGSSSAVILSTRRAWRPPWNSPSRTRRRRPGRPRGR